MQRAMCQQLSVPPSSKQQPVPLVEMLLENAPLLIDNLMAAGGPSAEMATELISIARTADVELEYIAMLHLSYESCCACTAVVCTGSDGLTLLGRTLDWELPLLEALNVQLRVFKRGKLLYHSVSWAGYIGVLTALRPSSQGYGLAINFRDATDGQQLVPVRYSILSYFGAKKFDL